MNPAVYITTSWDDGHPLDLRVAELLTKHRIGGTFYIPRIAEKETMSAAHIRQLSLAFEIGAHTLHHVPPSDRCLCQPDQGYQRAFELLACNWPKHKSAHDSTSDG